MSELLFKACSEVVSSNTKQLFSEVKLYSVRERERERECVSNDACKTEIKAGKMPVSECANVPSQPIR